jgi:flagellar basal-body rod modification protein FlgD
VSTIDTINAAAATSTPTTTSTGSTSSSGTGATLTNPTANLNDNTFLQLMVDQLQNQDPLNPTDTSDYLSQLAQFTSLEQETNTATATGQLQTETASTEALNLLGKTVSYTDSTGASQSGQVQSIDLTGSSPTLTIGTATGILTSQVTSVS